MAVTVTNRSRFHMDKSMVRQLAEEAQARAGIPYDPDATAEMARVQMLKDGVKSEDNILSREILKARYAEDFEE